MTDSARLVSDIESALGSVGEISDDARYAMAVVLIGAAMVQLGKLPIQRAMKLVAAFEKSITEIKALESRLGGN